MEIVHVWGELIIELRSLQDWVNKCPNRLPAKQRAGEQWLWLDAKGYILTCGEDFQAAEKKATYPVKVYRLKRTSDK